MHIVLLQNDLRTNDNPALYHASENGPCVALFCLDEKRWGPWRLNAIQRWWLGESLQELKKQLAKLAIPLVIRCGDTIEELTQLIRETKAQGLHYNRCYDPYRLSFGTLGIPLFDYSASLLVEPWELKPKQSDYYQVFTPFWKAYQDYIPFRKLLTKPQSAHKVATIPKSHELPASSITETDTWRPGEGGAQAVLKAFLDDSCSRYTHGRDLPAEPLTSKLSPHLHFGEISPVQIFHAVQERLSDNPSAEWHNGANTFLRELGWREFNTHLLYHYPELPSHAFNPTFQDFPWKDDSTLLEAWQQGQTGYPLVDAGMRQLKATGWMHNRVRMVVASFLTKDLLIPWQRGAEWFWDHLVDADLANNSANWQWVAGCGADAAPFFRIFNPVTQSEKFDPDSRYIQSWVPELRGLPTKFCHAPWKAPKAMINGSYPSPMVDHAEARARALHHFHDSRTSRGSC